MSERRACDKYRKWGHDFDGVLKDVYTKVPIPRVGACGKCSRSFVEHSKPVRMDFIKRMRSLGVSFDEATKGLYESLSERASDHPFYQLQPAVTEIDSVFDKQVGGSHYKNLAIQPTEFILANKLDFAAGNAVKYICRYPLKGTPLQDLEKAKHYIEILIEREKKNG